MGDEILVVGDLHDIPRHVSLISGRTAIPDLDRLTVFLDDAFEQLAVATGVHD